MLTRIANWVGCLVWGHEFEYWWGMRGDDGYFRGCRNCQKRWRQDRNTGWHLCQ